MAASWIELARNKRVKTNVDAFGVHTLVVTAGSSGTPSFIEWGRNQKLATDMNLVGDIEVHTLKYIEA